MRALLWLLAGLALFALAVVVLLPAALRAQGLVVTGIGVAITLLVMAGIGLAGRHRDAPSGSTSRQEPRR